MGAIVFETIHVLENLQFLDQEYLVSGCLVHSVDGSRS